MILSDADKLECYYADHCHSTEREAVSCAIERHGQVSQLARGEITSLPPVTRIPLWLAPDGMTLRRMAVRLDLPSVLVEPVLLKLHAAEEIAKRGETLGSHRCDSPIEVAFLTHARVKFDSGGNDALARSRRGVLYQQHAVELVRKGGFAFLDFAVKKLLPNGYMLKVAVELDGHQFHDATRERAAEDKSRDRDLVRDGWFVLRFTGTEVSRNAFACVDEVREVVEALSFLHHDKSPKF